MPNRSERSTSLVLFAPSARGRASELGLLFQRFGIQVEEVSELAALVAAAASVGSDLVVYDATCAVCATEPAVTCAEIVRTLCAPIVVLGDAGLVEPVLRAGAADALLRTFEPALLAQRVRREGARAEIEAGWRRALDELATCKAFGGIGEWSLECESGELSCSTAAQALFGWKPDDGPKTRASLVRAVEPEDRERFERWLDRAIAGAGAVTIDHDVLGADRGSWRVRQQALLAAGCGGAKPRLCGLVRAVETVVRPERRTRTLVVAEGLNGLADREQFLDRLTCAIAAAQPPHDQVATFLIQLDLEGLPECFTGREPRELLIGALAQRMKDSIRDRDMLGHLGSQMRDVSIARVGESRFTILLPGLMRSHDAYKAARRIYDSLIEPLSIERVTCSTRVNLGIAMYPADGATATALVEAAESAGRAASEPGHSSIQFYTAAMNASAFERLTLETSLRLAIERDELLVYYQPKIEIATGKISGFEALVRWKHPDLGLVSPAQFIPIAEETGLIVPIGDHVLRVACAQNKRWQNQGLPPVRVAVNLSSVQFRDPEISTAVKRILDSVGLAPEWLELELTESILLQKVETTIASLRQLKKTGIRLAIDDFGTGYSSLSYLKRFPIDTLKIDQSFIREVTTNPEDAAITTSIILMGKSLNLHVVAEGVETQSQLAFLKVLECDEAQGFLFSRPVPAEQAGELLATAVGNYR